MNEEMQRGFADFGTFINARILKRAINTGEPHEFERVVDGRLMDRDGRSVEDFISGWGTQVLGHRNPVIARALRSFLDDDLPTFFPSGISPHAGLLARKLWERTGYDNAFFASGGTEAVEAAIKLARAATRKPRILYLSGAYHGCTLGSNAMMAEGPFRAPFGPHLPAVDELPFGDGPALERALAQPDVAAVVVEPIQVEGGVRPLPPEYVQALCGLTGPEGVLLIADEIQTGLGRTGRFLVSETWPRRPDAVTLGKALGGGFVPVSCLLTRGNIFERAYGTGDLSEPHTATWSGNGLACAAALATLELLTEEVMSRTRRVGAAFLANLREAIGGSPLVRDIRGEGLLVGIETGNARAPHLSFEGLGRPELRHRGSAVGGILSAFLVHGGFFVMFCSHDWNVLRLQPQLDIGEDRLAAFTGVLRASLERLVPWPS
jgi:acetylornithine/succinyldiaminopimelate/putrescine aminotransferase